MDKAVHSSVFNGLGCCFQSISGTRVRYDETIVVEPLRPRSIVHGDGCKISNTFLSLRSWERCIFKFIFVW